MFEGKGLESFRHKITATTFPLMLIVFEQPSFFARGSYAKRDTAGVPTSATDLSSSGSNQPMYASGWPENYGGLDLGHGYGVTLYLEDNFITRKIKNLDCTKELWTRRTIKNDEFSFYFFQRCSSASIKEKTHHGQYPFIIFCLPIIWCVVNFLQLSPMIWGGKGK